MSYSTIFLVSFSLVQFSSSSLDVSVPPIEEFGDTFTHADLLPQQISKNVSELSITSSRRTRPEATDASMKTESKNFEKIQPSSGEPINTKTHKLKDDNVTNCTSLQLKVPHNENCSGYFLNCLRNGTHVETTAAREGHGQVNATFHASEWKTCPEGKNFDSIESKCMKKDEAHCGAYICIDYGFFPDTKNPSKFIHCLKGTGPKRMTCEPEGTVFNSDSKLCQWTPEKLPISLKLLKVLVWLVQVTGEVINRKGSPNDTNSTGHISSAEDFIKTTLVALLIPVMYLATVVFLYILFHTKKPIYPGGEPYDLDAEDFHRHYSRPQVRTSTASATAIGNGIDLTNYNPNPNPTSTYPQRRTRSVSLTYANENATNFATTRM